MRIPRGLGNILTRRAAVGALILVSAAAAISQTATMSLVDASKKHTISMRVSKQCEYRKASCECFSEAELTEFARKATFPLGQQLPAMDRQSPVILCLAGCKDFDSLACTVLDLNAKHQVYDQKMLLRVIQCSGRCSPEQMAQLQARHGN